MEKPPNSCQTGGGKSEDFAQAPSPKGYVEEEQFENSWEKKPLGLAEGLGRKSKRKKNWKAEPEGKAVEDWRVFEGIRLFFARLLAPLVFARLPRFFLAAESFRGALTVGLAIGGAESTVGELAVGFPGC